jgi:quercetin dioxygenase-like cupin family protein
MPFYSVDDLPEARPAAEIRRRAVYLEKTMITFFEFEQGAIVPPHDHPHEQITYVISGALEFTLEDETRVLRAGDGAAVPANARHRAIALEPSVLLDAWSPVRDDYR